MSNADGVRKRRWTWWLLLMPDYLLAGLIVPAIASAYLLVKGPVVAGIALLIVWVPLFWVVARALQRRGYARLWVALGAGVLAFAVPLLAFTLFSGRP